MNIRIDLYKKEDIEEFEKMLLESEVDDVLKEVTFEIHFDNDDEIYHYKAIEDKFCRVD